MRFPWLLTVLGMAALARADVGSTLDEWADRFAPEPGPAPKLPEYADGFDRAKANLTAGRYRAALVDVFTLDQAAPRCSLLHAEALIGLGESQDALELLAAPAVSGNHDAMRLRIETFLDQQNGAEALRLIDKVLAATPEDWAAHRQKGQALELLGRYKDAIDAYHWFLDPAQDYLRKWQTDADAFEDATGLTELATSLHRWATLTSAYKDVQQLNDTVLAMYTRAFDVLDRGYDPARIAAARFCLSRGDREKAGAILAPVSKRTPMSRAFLEISAEAAAESGSDSGMHEIADRIRTSDPDSVTAGLLEVNALARARSGGAVTKITALHKAWPQRLDVAGAFAALSFLAGDERSFGKTLADADAQFPTRAEAHFAAAEILEAALQREAAINLLKTVISRTPWETAPRHLLGDIYLNDGYDAEARAALEEARALDPYNVKTANYLTLLDELDRFDKRRTEHFILYSDKDADPITAEQIGDYLEAVYAEVCADFQYWPKTKIIVQIYPDNDAFSVRMAGVPGVENYGVSFGRVLAAIAPRKGTSQGNFNWARVLRHEFVHTINLMQTRERCPRWLTEGLAVWQEKVPFRFVDVPAELYKRTFADDLFSIREFPLAFLRPRRPGDGEQAYTQSAYLAMYLEATYGKHSIVKLLDGYGQLKTNEEAFLAVTGKPMAQVEADWHAWMKDRLKPWGYDEDSIAKAKELAEQGDAQVKGRDLPAALTTWRAANDLQPMEVKPHQRLAGLYLQKTMSDPAKAIEHLKFLHVLELSDNRYAKRIARLYDGLGDEASALHWAREATFVDLYDAAAHDMMAEYAAKAGDEALATKAKQSADQVRLWQDKQKAAKSATPENN